MKAKTTILQNEHNDVYTCAELYGPDSSYFSGTEQILIDN
jgi:hypothetical protein